MKISTSVTMVLTMQADLRELPIEDREVTAAVQRLQDSYQNIRKNGNTIVLNQWAGLADIGCGIAYSINGTDAPKVQFMTVLVPLSEDGWYYYVDDYNEWRNEHG